MKNKKTIALVLLGTLLASGLSYSFANEETSNSFGFGRWNGEQQRQFDTDAECLWEMQGPKENNKWIRWLSEEEQEAFQNMSDEEKETFLNTKREEKRAEAEARQEENQARENVIDKLLAWESLTTEEETLRQEIITERATRKQEMEERKALMDKKISGEELTEEEEAILNEMRGGKWGRWGNFGKNKNK